MTNYNKLIIKLNIIWAVLTVLALANIFLVERGGDAAVYVVGMFVVSSINLVAQHFGDPENKS